MLHFHRHLKLTHVGPDNGKSCQQDLESFIPFICDECKVAPLVFRYCSKWLGVKGPDDIFNYPGTFNYDFFSPKSVSLGYLESKGVNRFRIAFAWERIMPDLSTNELNSAYVSHLDKAVAYITKNGTSTALLEMHSYGRYYFIGSEEKFPILLGTGGSPKIILSRLGWLLQITTRIMYLYHLV